MKHSRSIIYLILCISMGLGCNKTQDLNSKTDVTEIKNVLMAQEEAWNNGNLEDFMKGYWKDDRLTFIGKSGINYGWTTTLNNYRRGYPDKEAMGILKFKVIELNPLSPELYHALGQYTLTRKEDQPTGFFSLLWRKIDGQWLIISDHTSG